LVESEFEKIDITPVKDTKEEIIVKNDHVQESNDKKRP
jgi:hypothetical protein